MTTKHLLDPELHQLLEIMPPFDLDDEQLPLLRDNPAMAVELGDSAKAGVTRQEIHAAGGDGPDVRALLYRPSGGAASGASYLHIHGGGYILGIPEMSDPVNLQICASLSTPERPRRPGAAPWPCRCPPHRPLQSPPCHQNCSLGSLTSVLIVGAVGSNHHVSAV